MAKSRRDFARLDALALAMDQGVNGASRVRRAGNSKARACSEVPLHQLDQALAAEFLRTVYPYCRSAAQNWYKRRTGETEHLAQDLVTTVYQLLWYHGSRPSGRPFSEMVPVVVRRYLGNLYRSSMRRPGRELYASISSPTEAEAMEYRIATHAYGGYASVDLRHDLRQAASRLSKRDQDVVAALYANEGRVRDTARALGLTPTLVSKVASRFRTAYVSQQSETA